MGLDIETGDFVFGFIGPADNPISAVTSGFRGARVNHLGIAIKNAKGSYVLEAFPPEVRVTNLTVYARRTNDAAGEPRMLHGRLRPEFRALIPEALRYGLAQRDLPYDRLYLTDEDALYCSELVVDMFADANGGSPFFEERAMSFRDPITGDIAQSWIDYYAYFGLAVPDGQPGSNPGDISLDPRLNMLAVVGSIPGYAP